MTTPYHSEYTGAEVDEAVALGRELQSSTLPLTSLTGLTGGLATDLDGIATVDLAAGTRALVVVAGVLYIYELQEGVSAEASPSIIRPDDFDETSGELNNEKVWALVRVNTSALEIIQRDSGTTGFVEAVSFTRNTSAVPVAGFGSRMNWYLKSDTTEDQLAASMDVVWSTATDATRSARIQFGLVDQAVAPANDALVMEYVTVNTVRYPALGIGTRPSRLYHAKYASASVDNVFAIENTDTTNFNGSNLSFRTNTTGVGAASFQTLAGIRALYLEHDHPTRQGSMELFIDNQGSLEFLKFRPGNALGFGTVADGSFTQVITERQTGWTAPTGTATRTGFDTATATTAQLAEHLKALIDDLTTHGLIGV